MSFDALLLLLDLYHAHALDDHFGLPWRDGEGCRQSYHRRGVGDVGHLTLWAFTQTQTDETGWPDAEGEWGLLSRLGLVRFVPHLVDAPNGDVVFSLGEEGHDGAGSEDGWWQDRQAACLDLLPPQLRHGAESADALVACPANWAKVQVVDIARLTFRPDTSATKRWLAKLSKGVDRARSDLDAWLDRYRREWPDAYAS